MKKIEYRILYVTNSVDFDLKYAENKDLLYWVHFDLGFYNVTELVGLKDLLYGVGIVCTYRCDAYIEYIKSCFDKILIYENRISKSRNTIICFK